MGASTEKNEAVRSAQRYREATDWQAQTRDDRSEAEGLNRRREFMLASGRVFFESIIDQSDLMPIRTLSVGIFAGQAVGRIHLPPSRLATGFLVAPNLLITIHHALPSREWALSAALTMDAEDGIDSVLDIETPEDVREVTVKEIERLTDLEFTGR